MVISDLIKAHQNERGAVIIQYITIVAILALGMIGAMTNVKLAIADRYDYLGVQMTGGGTFGR